MNSSSLGVLVGQMVAQLPLIVVCVVAMVVLLAKRESAGAGFVWGLAGFLALLLSALGSPIAVRVIWAFFPHHNIFFAANSVFWSLLRAGACALLLVAIVAGRADRAHAA